MSARVPEGLGRVEVEDIDGRKLHLDETWANKPAVLVFVRHFG